MTAAKEYEMRRMIRKACGALMNHCDNREADVKSLAVRMKATAELVLVEIDEAERKATPPDVLALIPAETLEQYVNGRA